MLNNDKNLDENILKYDTENKTSWSLVEGALPQPGGTLKKNAFGDLSVLI